ncbi:hypothetical protein GIB67_039031 [Kingdonia uniflora]|uniref:Helicase ATP-binding domain-containing protein n=1 Tax=Kingdonia uniflora TaxID=39325 RepID=A0A7J7LL39_9MAGN|nr:hypothetical protein GIB67_039031 [Kingdonia uniflora]
MGYSKAGVKAIMEGTYVEKDEVEDDVPSVVGGSDEVSPRTEFENQGEELKDMRLRIEELKNEFATEKDASTSLLSSQAKLQRYGLREGVNIVVVTPGRFIDHLQQGNTTLSRISFVILDEANKMLDMGFKPQIKEVMRNLPTKHQTLLFNTAMPVEIEILTQSNASSSQVVGAKEFESSLNKEIVSSTAIAMIDAKKYEAVPEALSIGDECPSQQALSIRDEYHS